METVREDIVNKEAFKVLKNELIPILEKNNELSDLCMALGLGVSTREFLSKNNHENLFLLLKTLPKETTTERLKILLESSDSLHEFMFKTIIITTLRSSIKLLEAL